MFRKWFQAALSPSLSGFLCDVFLTARVLGTCAVFYLQRRDSCGVGSLLPSSPLNLLFYRNPHSRDMRILLAGWRAATPHHLRRVYKHPTQPENRHQQ